MAFTVHWPTVYARRSFRNENFYHHDARRKIVMDRLCTLAPILSVQADCIYPNAEASILSAEETGEIVPPTGCVGHQMDNPFPVASRTPVPLPLVMYPSNDVDTCALPVMNWEEYVYTLYASAKSQYIYYFPSFGNKNQRKEIARKRLLAASEASRRRLAIVRGEVENESSNMEKPPKRITYADTRQALLAPDKVDDLEALEHELSVQKEMRKEKKKKKTVPRKKKGQKEKEEIPIPTGIYPHSVDKYKQLNHKTLRKFLNVPKVHVKGTWNYLYSGTGACNWIYDSDSRRRKHLFVANGTKLRMLTLRNAKPEQMLTYVLDGVWEEEEIPTNVDLNLADSDDPLSSQIYQIKTHRRRNFIGVRRGKSVEIYTMSSEVVPSLLASIPNVGYGSTRYAGLTTKVLRQNPLLTSFDLNPYFPSEIVTMDENAIIQFIDITYGKATSQLRATKKVYPEDDLCGPQKVLNDATGVTYVGGHPEVVLYWSDSCIHLHDKREKNPAYQTRELFNLRTSVSTLSFSDQDYFRNKNQILDEYLSTLITANKNPLHYYFGTTQRILLMDLRVPRNPVLKMSHGLASPPVYMDVFSDDDFEVLVAGSQRNSETFCAFFDKGHVACHDRPNCQQRNPIFQSPPKHLSSAREFFDFADEQQFSCAWESDYQRAKERCYAWTTGLCLMKPSITSATHTLPSSFILFNGNAFGDVFVQEWDQQPVLPTRKVEASDVRLKSFMRQWRDSMQAPLNVLPDPPAPARYVDHTLLIEAAAEGLKSSEVHRSVPFDCFTPHALVYDRVRKGLPSVLEQVNALDPPSQIPRGQSVLRHWADWSDFVPEDVTAGGMEESFEPLLLTSEPSEEAEIKDEGDSRED